MPPEPAAIWHRKPLRGRHRERTLIARARDELAAEAWAQPWRPGPGDRLAVLRLRRGMRRWIRTPAAKKLP